MAILFLDLAGTLVDLDAYLHGQATNLCFVESSLYSELKTVDCVLVTASPEAQVEKVLRLTGLDEAIAWQAIIAAEQGGNQKASGEPFRDYLSVYNDNAIHVGDSDADEEGAMRAGIPFVRVFKKESYDLQGQELTRAIREAMHILLGGK